MARDLQLSFPVRPTWGGRRRGAGRKPTPGRRPSVPHRSRPSHSASNPVHVTLRTTSSIRCLRAARVFPAVRAALTLAPHDGFRVVHFSVQDDHLHLIVEADAAPAFARGVRGLAIRLARAVNRSLGRCGPVWDGRYHAHPLETPREMRHALVYVLMNRHKHHDGDAPLDPCSSAAWFEGWRESVAPLYAPSPVARPRTWLAAVGWRRHGLIGFDERPRG